MECSGVSQDQLQNLLTPTCGTKGCGVYFLGRQGVKVQRLKSAAARIPTIRWMGAMKGSLVGESEVIKSSTGTQNSGGRGYRTDVLAVL